jgi:tetratricopeptide (TPR) repeat protein
MWVDEPPATTAPLALEAAEHAHRLDPTLPEVYASLGLISANYHWDWSKAEQHFQRALELNPSCSPARLWYAEFLAEMGRIDEALETIDRARAHDPRSSAVQATRAFVFLLGHRFDDAIAQAQLVLEIDPDYPMALIRLGLAYAGKGRYAEAVLAFQASMRAAPGLLDCASLLGYAYARAGNTREALRQLSELQRHADQRYVPAFLFANVYAGLGQYDQAIAAIEEEYNVRGWYLLLIKQTPHLDVLRSHPRFNALLRRMDFPG